MKRHILCSLLIAIVSLFSVPHLQAYDFAYEYEGNTLYYNITGENTCEVTYLTLNGSNYPNIGDHVVIPENVIYASNSYSVTSIGDRAFYCCNFSTIEIPNSVTSIGERAISGCHNITSIILPNSVITIGDFVFGTCSKLKIIRIPNSVTTIGNGAFFNCSSLTTIEIPNAVTSIGDYTFSECSGLTSIEIPNSVTSIGDNAFTGCRNLTSIEIPNSVTSIGDYAFNGCLSLTSIEIPETVTSLGNGVFYSCRSLTSIKIPNSVTSIGDYTFSDCGSLTSIEIPNSVTFIGGYAFSRCSGLTSIEIPSSVTSLGSGVFYFCDNLTSIEMSNSVTSIGQYAFYECSRLTSIEIPKSLTSIDRYAFHSCWSLVSVEIPNSVTSIGDYAFGSSGLKEIFVHNIDPQNISLGVYVFQTNVQSCTLYVRPESVELYKSAPQWCDFANIEAGPTCAKPIISFDDGVCAINCDTEGATIFYTLDGSAPTYRSNVYNGPMPLNQNYIVRAFAMYKGYFDSEEASLTIDSFFCPTPVIKYEDNICTISCDSEGSVIHYTLDGSDPTKESSVYTEPITITEQCTIKAMAIFGERTLSDIASYNTAWSLCAQPEIKYDGREYSITASSNYRIYYSVDNQKYIPYTQICSAEGVRSVRAYCAADGMNNSEIAALDIHAYYDPEANIATVYDAGYLSQAFGWIEGNDTNFSRLKVEGAINDADFAALRELKQLVDLDLSAVTVGDVPGGAFEGMTALRYVVMPEKATGYGSGLFKGCASLGAVKWGATEVMPAGVLDGVPNPNLLLFVADKAYAPSGYKGNLVANLVADKITLVDGEFASFFTPERFTARQAEYTHDYTLETRIGVRAGWETIVLPFDVETITHTEKGEISPFVGGDGELHFWLSGIDGAALKPTTRIEAYRPYAISMPNSPEYAAEYNLNGAVTFSAKDVEIDSRECEAQVFGRYKLAGTMHPINKNKNYSVLNLEEYDGRRSGSVFVDGLRDVRAFEAYVLNSDDTPLRAPLPIGEMMDEVNYIGSVAYTSTARKIFTATGTISIVSESDSTVDIYTVTGLYLRTVTLTPGLNTIADLPIGTYIVKN